MEPVLDVVGRDEGRGDGLRTGEYGRAAELVLLDVEDWEFDGAGLSVEPVLALQVGSRERVDPGRPKSRGWVLWAGGESQRRPSEFCGLIT